MQFQEGEDALTRNRPAEVRVGPMGFCEAPPSQPGTICMFAAHRSQAFPLQEPL